MQTRELYVELFVKKVSTPEEFLDQIINHEHPFYGAAREYAVKIMSRDQSWRWLSYRLDDFGEEAEKIVSKKIQRWKFKAILGVGKMPICDTKSTIKWLFNRMVSEYKNLFDIRSRNFIDVAKSDNELKIRAISKMGYHE
ncbi:MAG TPA: hypothetical protein EYG74_04275 [Sulfurimonas autotrophica]|nr:hypothetical protein [Sulfurimonas autotrophica]